MISSGINLVMTVIGFAVSTMFMVFVCTRLVCARVQLNASRRRSFPTATRSDLSILERGLHGLDPMVVATFPTREFRDEFLSSGADTQCTVCLAEYQEKDTLRTLPSCGHAFHACCIDIWLRQHSTCPVCRISLLFTLEKRRILPPMFSSVVRSHRGSPDTCDPSYMYSSNEYHSRTDDNQRLESIEEDDYQIDNFRARETTPGEMGGGGLFFGCESIMELTRIERKCFFIFTIGIFLYIRGSRFGDSSQNFWLLTSCLSDGLKLSRVHSKKTTFQQPIK